MKTIEIYGRSFTGEAAHTRIACRGLVIREDKVLLSHERNTGWYLIPGGGLEDGETIEAGCIREMQEETGFLVEPTELLLTIREGYGDWLYISHYFLCRELGQGEQSLTETELRRGLVPEWVPLTDALAIFAEHEQLTHYEEKRGSYKREHSAISAYLEHLSGQS